MNEISVEELMELYVETLANCGTYLLNEDDETIDYNIFEEFDIGVISFLHHDSLNKLLLGKYINTQEMEDSLKLREMVLDIQNNNQWNIESLKSSNNWKKVLVLADNINKSLRERKG